MVCNLFYWYGWGRFAYFRMGGGCHGGVFFQKMFGCKLYMQKIVGVGYNGM
jgi:hypothetical protein